MPRASASAPPPGEATPAKPLAVEDEVLANEKLPARPAAARRPQLTETLTPLRKTRKHLNALYFGQEGTGKTSALAHMANLPGDGVVIIVNAEGGLIIDALEDLGVDVDRVMVWPPEPEPGQPKLKVNFANLEKLQKQAAIQLKNDPGSIKGIGFDSLTELHLALLGGAVERAMKKYEDTGKGRGDGSDRFDVEQSDWGVMTSQVLELLRNFRDLPCHFGATALERQFEAKHGDSDVPQYGPDLNPGLAGKVLGLFDLCLRLVADNLTVAEGESETLITAYTQKTRTVRAKDRLHRLPAKLPDPNFVRLVGYFTKELTQDQDPLFERHLKIRQASNDYRATKRATGTTPNKEK